MAVDKGKKLIYLRLLSSCPIDSHSWKGSGISLSVWDGGEGGGREFVLPDMQWRCNQVPKRIKTI